MRVKTSKKELWRSIRAFCLECICNIPREIELCTAPRCPLYRSRYGRAPKPTDLIFLDEKGKYRQIDDLEHVHWYDTSGNLIKIQKL